MTVSHYSKNIQHNISYKYRIVIPYSKASYAKSTALIDINSFDEYAYYVLLKYCEDLDSNNFNSMIVLKSTLNKDSLCFQQMF